MPRQQRRVVLYGPTGRRVQNVARDDVGDEGHDAQVCVERPEGVYGLPVAHPLELEDGDPLLLRGGLQPVHAPAVDVRGAPGRDHRVAPVHEGVQYALAKGRLPDHDDPHVSHCAQPPATGLDAAPEYTIWHLAGQRRTIRLVGTGSLWLP